MNAVEGVEKPKRIRPKNNIYNQMNCSQCSARVNSNRFGTCKDCRTSMCGQCKQPFVQNRTLARQCPVCLARLNYKAKKYPEGSV